MRYPPATAMATLVCLATLSLLAMPLCPARGDTVGHLGHPDRMQFEGNEHFSDEYLRMVLWKSPTLYRSGTPSHPLDRHIRNVREVLAELYRREGFAAVSVRVRGGPDDQHLRAMIREGPRVRRGPLSIRGLDPELRDELRDWLTRTHDAGLSHFHPHIHQRRRPGVSPDRIEPGAVPHEAVVHIERIIYRVPDATDISERFGPIWPKDRPLDVRPRAMQGVESMAAFFLLKRGYPMANLHTRITIDHDHRAALMIEVLDRGEHRRHAQLELTGLERHTTQQVLEFLAIGDPKRFDTARLREVYRKLWDSARFAVHDLEWWLDHEGQQQNRIMLTLRELEGVPLLDEPLGERDLAAIRAAGFINSRLDYDVIMAGVEPFGPDSLRMKVVLSTEHGVLVRLSWPAGDGRSEALTLSVIAGPDLMAVLCDEREEFWALNGGAVTITAPLVIGPLRGKSTERVFRMHSTFEITGRSSRQDSYVHFRRIPPAALMYLAGRNTKEKDSGDGFVDLVARQGPWYRIDLASGRPLPPPDNGSTFTVFMEKDHVAGHVAMLEERKPQHNRFSTDDPLGSLLAMLVESLELMVNADADGSEAGQKQGHALIARLLSARNIAPLARAMEADVEALVHEAPILFLYPGDERIDPLFMDRPGKDRLFAHGSWPWTMLREVPRVRPAGGLPHESFRELQRLMSDPRTGPIGFMVIAHLLDRMRIDDLTPAVAAMGRARLSQERFAADVRTLLTGEGAVPETLCNIIRTIEAFHADERQALLQRLPEPAAGMLERFLVALEQQDHDTLEQRIEAAMLQLWDEGLGDLVEAELKRLSVPRPAD